jgi:hypothetical protein
VAVLKRIAALSDRGEQERQLLECARYLAPDVMRELLMGQGPMGPSNCARFLQMSIKAGRYDRPLVPLVAQIEKRAIQAAGRKLIDRRGKVNYTNRFAAELVPGLTRLSILELIRLKCLDAWKDLRARLGF